jgi:hypothetical protein
MCHGRSSTGNLSIGQRARITAEAKAAANRANPDDQFSADMRVEDSRERLKRKICKKL